MKKNIRQKIGKKTARKQYKEREKKSYIEPKKKCFVFIMRSSPSVSLFLFVFLWPVVFVWTAQWFGTAKKFDVSTGPLTRPFFRLLAPHCSLCSRAPLHTFICLLNAHSLTHSQAHGKLLDGCYCSVFFLFRTIVRRSFFLDCGPLYEQITTPFGRKQGMAH